MPRVSCIAILSGTGGSLEIRLTYVLPKLVGLSKVIVDDKLSLWDGDPDSGAFVRPDIFYFEP
jgi:hypothetical protein